MTKKIPMYTYSGRVVDLSDLHKGDIDMVDIAHALSNLCRYNGHVKKFYSVAEHSVHLARYAWTRYSGDVSWKLAQAMLLHDASEAYVGDIIYHLKGSLPGFVKKEDAVIEAIMDKYDLADFWHDNHNDLIKPLDRAICIDEMKVLMHKTDPILDTYTKLGVEIECWTPEKAESEFLATARMLKLH